MILYFLPMILFLGVITSYEDIKEGKIRNKWILLALIYALIVNLGLIIYYTLFSTIRWDYFVDFSINFLIALIAGFLMWDYKLWSAGDAKLFLAYALLIPLSVYKNNYMDYFPSFVILVNTFVPGTIYAVVYVLVTTTSHFKQKMIKKLSFKEFTLTLANFFGISWIIGLLSGLIGLHSLFIQYLLTFGIYSAISNVLNKKYQKLAILAMLVIIGLRVIFDDALSTLIFWKRFFGYSLFFIAARHFIKAATQKLCTKNVAVSELKEGMLVGEDIATKKSLQSKIKEIIGRGLTKEDIKLIKKYIKKDQLKKITIEKTLPFAPFMLLGVLLTLIAEGDFVRFIYNITYYLWVYFLP